jgi:hypothetical protein
MDILDALINGPKPVVVPSPMDPLKNALGLATQQVTLGQLANQSQMSALDLQQRQQLVKMMSDPRYAAAMGSLMQGSAGGGDWPGLFKDFPMAAGPAFTQQVGTIAKMADIDKTRADAAKATTDARKEQMLVLANAADGLAKSDGPLVPDKVMTFLRQGQYVGAGPLLGDVVSAVKTGDEGQIRQALLNFSQAGSTMAQRTTAAKDAGATALQVPQYNLDRYKALIDAGKVEVKQDVNGNMVLVPTHGALPSAPPAQGAQPAAGMPYDVAPTITSPQDLAAVAADAAKSGYTPAPGVQATSAPPSPVAAAAGAAAQPGAGIQPTGVQLALSPEQTAMAATRTKTLEDARANSMVAQRALMVLPALRTQLAQGYTGPIAGSEAGRALLNFAVTINALSPEQAQRVAAMRASDSLVTELLGPMAHQFNSRGSNFALKVVQNAKPGAENSLPIAMQMINALQTDARNVISYDKGLNDYVTGNPRDYGLSGWKPPAPGVPPPAGKYADSLPPASLANLGYRAYGDDGRVYESNGREWVLKK